MTKIALVTGGTRGIGASISIALKNAGYNVAATYNSNTEKANAFASENGIEVFQWNVADAAACEAGVKQVQDKMGSVDILINNLGIYERKPFFEIEDSDWTRFFEVNVMSGVRFARFYTPKMIDKKWQINPHAKNMDFRVF